MSDTPNPEKISPQEQFEKDLALCASDDQIVAAYKNTKVKKWSFATLALIAVAVSFSPALITTILLRLNIIQLPADNAYMLTHMTGPLALAMIFPFLIFARSVQGANDASVIRNIASSARISFFVKTNNLHSMERLPDEIANMWSLSKGSGKWDINLTKEGFNTISTATLNDHEITIFKQTRTYTYYNRGRQITEKISRWAVAVKFPGILPDIFLRDPSVGGSYLFSPRLPSPADIETRYAIYARRAYGNEAYELISKEFISLIETDSTPHSIELSGNYILFTLPTQPSFDSEVPQLRETFKLATKVIENFSTIFDRASFTPIGDIPPALPRRTPYVIAAIALLAVLPYFIPHISAFINAESSSTIIYVATLTAGVLGLFLRYNKSRHW